MLITGAQASLEVPRGGAGAASTVHALHNPLGAPEPSLKPEPPKEGKKDVLECSFLGQGVLWVSLLPTKLTPCHSHFLTDQENLQGAVSHQQLPPWARLSSWAPGQAPLGPHLTAAGLLLLHFPAASALKLGSVYESN